MASIETINVTDTIFNALPMFHSFGLTVGTLFPLLEGAKLFLYPSPLHYRVISEIVYEIGASVMFGTDTFFRGYAKIAHPIDFHNIRFMFGGAEAIKPDTRNMWVERFGIRVMEAYGSTECSPVVTANNRIFNRFGSIGKLLPKIQHKIIPVDGIENGGELVVKGPNIMMGYIMPDNPGVLVPLEGGWYHTGDVVDIDEIGFVFIKDRIKRFAKSAAKWFRLMPLMKWYAMPMPAREPNIHTEWFPFRTKAKANKSFWSPTTKTSLRTACTALSAATECLSSICPE